MDDMEIAMNSRTVLDLVNSSHEILEVSEYISDMCGGLFNLCPEDVTNKHAAIAKRCLAQLQEIEATLRGLESL